VPPGWPTWKKSRPGLETVNTADNADITQSQACDTRHRRMQTACAQITFEPNTVLWPFHTIQPSSFVIALYWVATYIRHLCRFRVRADQRCPPRTQKKRYRRRPLKYTPAWLYYVINGLNSPEIIPTYRPTMRQLERVGIARHGKRSHYATTRCIHRRITYKCCMSYHWDDVPPATIRNRPFFLWQQAASVRIAYS